jgi:uncharacterized damage-inducible protein DinB
MRKTLVVLALVCASSFAVAQQAGGVKAEILHEFQGAEEHLVALAEALPQDKFAYTPGPGVRTAAEVFLHVAIGNYMYASFLGVPLPEGFQPRGFEKSTTDKAQIVEHLKKSFAFARQAIEGATDLEKTVKSFTGEKTARGLMLQMVAHAHEHLGQAIAYARGAGVTPPWTAERQQRQAQPAAPKKE